MSALQTIDVLSGATPGQADDLIYCTDELIAGDPRPLLNWQATEGRGIARRMSPALGKETAERAVAELQTAAWRARSIGTVIPKPEGWTHRVLRRICDRIQSERVPDRSAELPALVAPLCPPEIDSLDEQAMLRRRIALVAATLTPPYGDIIRLRKLHGITRKRAIVWVRSWRGTSHNQGRWLLRRANEMFRFTVGGGDPRAEWPGRYKKKNPYCSTPPPPDPGT